MRVHRRSSAPYRLAWVTLACGLTAVLAHELREGDRLLLDEDILSRIAAWRSPSGIVVATDITALGSATVVTLFASCACVVFALARKPRIVARLIASVVGALLLSSILKAFVSRDRPSAAISLTQTAGDSFPSGHAFVASALFVAIAVIARERFGPSRATRAVVILCTAIASLVAVSRVYLGAHYPTDVLAGFALGTSWALGVAWWIRDEDRGEDEPAVRSESD